ncbi:hypothetical protein Cni_G04431 [Canna indica]|uniref:Transcription repressor n=1 Tax=Canna indica TaxID=4628 RepID=A0AAQ3Q4H5_9LILI|nr:hypothetical protein Cni_G04431 [Canna indica]
MDYCKPTNTECTSKLNHRFAQLLLGSSCTTTIATCTRTKPPTSPHRRKLDLHSPFSAADRRRVAPLVHASVDTAEPSPPLIPMAALAHENGTKMEINFYDVADRSRKKTAVERKKKTAARRAEAKKTLLSNAYGFTSSSLEDSENELGLFSSGDDDDEEQEEEYWSTLFSSKIFSSDTTAFYTRSKNKRQYTRSKSMKSTRRPPPPPRRHVRGHSCGAIDQLRPLVSVSAPRASPKKEKSAALGAAGFAVVKRSSDPYCDFRSSMVEMIVERGMSRGRDLERLLRSYLTLNSPRHHQVILEAFNDIWEAIFGT